MKETVVLRDQSGSEHRATISGAGEVTVGDTAVRTRPAIDGSVQVQGNRTARAWAAVSEGTRWVFIDGEVFTFEVDSGPRRRRSTAQHGSLTAPMPATVRKIVVKPGDAVRQGDVLIVLEAMKMELPVRAPAAGTVRAIRCEEGEMVQAGHELVEVDP